MSNGSKVIALGALEPPKADFSITLRPLKLQISEKVLRPSACKVPQKRELVPVQFPILIKELVPKFLFM